MTGLSGTRTLEKCFQDAEETGELDLRGRNLREFPDVSAERELIDVIKVDLSKNKFTELPPEICEFVMLERLVCYHNAIKSIPDASQLRSLTHLDLSRNQIPCIPTYLCNLPLRVLNLSNNKICMLPVEIGHLTLLQSLDLSCNELNQLPSSMGEMISLKELNVRRNNITVLPDELSKLKLVRLDFSCNRVRCIPPAYRLMTALTVLELNNNPLESPPASICAKGRIHIFKYLSMAAQYQEKRRGLDRDNKFLRMSVIPNEIDYNTRNGLINEQNNENFEKDNFAQRKNSLKERERVHMETIPTINKSQDLEKTRELLTEAKESEQELDEMVEKNRRMLASEEDDDLYEGEELQQDLLAIEKEERLKDEHQMAEETKTETKPTTWDKRLQLSPLASYSGMVDYQKALSLDQQQIHNLPHRSLSLKGTSSTGESYSRKGHLSKHEEEVRAKKREFLMQQSREEARLSRLKLEEEKMKSKQQQSLQQPKQVSLPPVAGHGDDEGRDQFASPDEDASVPGITRRRKLAQSRTAMKNLKENKTPNFTIKRMYDSAREEFELLEKLRETIESRLKISLPDDLPASLANGVVLCHLVNSIRRGAIVNIHVPSAGVPKLTMTKCQKNVDSFLDACKRFGVEREKLCTAADILQERRPVNVCVTVQALLQQMEQLHI